MERTMQMPAADMENRTAFLEQLRALLVQSRHIMEGNHKGKLRDLQLGIETWIKEVDQAGLLRSTNFSSNSAVLATPLTSQGQPQPEFSDTNTEIDTYNGKNSNKNSNENSHVESSLNIAQGSASTSVGDIPTDSTPHRDGLSSFAVNTRNGIDEIVPLGSANKGNSFSSDFGSRNLEDIAEFFQLFFASGLQEIVKLRSIGRNGARLVIVRCFSIITCALEQVVREIYIAAPGTVESNLSTNGEVDSSLCVSFFVRLAHDIRISVNAVMKCLGLLTVHTDLLSVRFATQVCTDILKQLRQCVFIFTQRLLRGEMHCLCLTGCAAASSNLDLQDATRTQQLAGERVKKLRRIMGPSLLNSVDHIMALIRPAVQYLISVVTLKGYADSQEERILKNDVCANLFALAQWMTSTVWLKRQKQRLHSTDATAKGRGEDSSQERPFNVDMTQFGLMEDIDSLEAMNPLIHQAAHSVVESVLQASFSPEYISCVARHCGDQNESQLLAARLLSEAIKKLTETNVEELQYVLRCVKWRKRIAEGILHCLVSLQPAVLEAGLDTLHRIVVECVDYLGSEIGFLYTSCVFGLLESDSTPLAMRRALLQHVVDTFFGSTNSPGQPFLLLRLYQHFDLNVRWHHLNVVQQAVATLSKAVRCAASEEFADEKESKGVREDPTAPKRSTPFLALQGLLLAVERLAVHIPQDACIAEGKILPEMSARDKKMEEQRAVDIVNSSPIKGLKKLFDINDEEMNPSGIGTMAAENNWAHQHIPPPTSAETEAKVRRIAQFLMETPSLNPESVAEFLSYPAVLPLQVCQTFMKTLPLAGKSLLEGLKNLFSLVQLPKEGQRIERLLEYFCTAYFEANSVEGVDLETFPFESENACFIAGVAVLMLNTNLHNPQVSSAKMTASSFNAQLRGCNEGKDFPERFTKGIFNEINVHSLSGMKGFWSAGMSSGVRYATVPFPGKMDSIFFSSEERRELAFGVVRQRLVSETRELIYRCSRIEASTVERTPLFWFGVTRDLFLSTWPSLCAVFGVAVHETCVPEEALTLCVRGLRSSFLVAAAFGLHTECDVSQAALLRMASFEPMRDVCQKGILNVASSPHSFFFSARCWTPVVRLLIAACQHQQSIVVEAESVFGRIEEFTRKSCVNNDEGIESDESLSFKEVVQEMLKGILSVVQDTHIDGATLSAALHVLRRALSYSLILHEQRQEVVVTNLINVRDFSCLVVPALVDVIEARSGNSDECLQLVVGFAVDVLNTMWNSCVYDVPLHCVVLQSELIESYAFFQRCYERCEASAEVRVHVLRGVKGLITRTLDREGLFKTRPIGLRPHTLHIMALLWQRLLQPVARALSDKGSVGTETCSLAVHVLRKLVAFCSGVGGAAGNIPIQKKVCNILLLLLSNVAYIGVMCSDVDSAQLCLSQLSTMCTTTLNQNAVFLLEGELTHFSEDEAVQSSFVKQNEALLLWYLVESIRKNSDVLILHLLERMSLLLLCQAQQIRTEVITVLRPIATQLKPLQLQHFAVHLSDAVLEVSLGHATSEYKLSVTDPSYMSYALFDLQVPVTMRICSPTSFRTTLPDVLKFMSHELFADVAVGHVNFIATIVMKHCMLPLAVSPRSSFQVRTTAVRSLMQCVLLCITRQTVEGDALCLDIITECVSLVLLAARIPVSLIVPDTADYAGRQWVTEKRSSALSVYMREGIEAIEALGIAEAHQVTGSFLSSTCGNARKSNARVECEEFDRTTRCNRSLPHGDVVTDEQLVEYCTLMAQLLSPLPKVLETIFLRARGEKKADDGMQQPRESALWTLPFADHRILAQLVLETVGTFFAIFWRVNHVGEMESFITKSAQQGRDAPPMRKSNALLPHVAIRGGLNAFLALALSMDVSDFHEIIVEILRVTATVQTLTLSNWEAQKTVEGTTESIAVQRLSPQEQQHMRSCNVGMYQELSSVITHWTRTIVQQTDTTTSVLSNRQREELQKVARNSEVFLGLSRLLTVPAGTVIVAIREYLVWYISFNKDLETQLEVTKREISTVPQHEENGNNKGNQQKR